MKSIIDWLKRVLSGGRSSPPLESPPPARKCEHCEKPQVIHVTTVVRGSAPAEIHLCEFCAQAWITSMSVFETSPGHNLADPDDEVQIEVERLIISEIHEEQVLIFREAGGNRRLHFVLGIFEAYVIDRTLKALPSPRPLTHDSWLASVEALGAQIESACIYDRQETTFFAELRMRHGDEVITLDMRPSDAVSIALKSGAPFLIREGLLSETPDLDQR